MVQNRLTKCQVNTDLDHRSNHLPVGIAIALKAQPLEERATRNWKQMDSKAVKGMAKELLEFDYQEASP